MIRIKRHKRYVDWPLSYKVVLDGNVIGVIDNDKECEFEVSPGKHKIFLKVQWCSSKVIDFELNGNSAEFECCSNMTMWKMIFLGVAYVTFLRDQWIWFEQIR